MKNLNAAILFFMPLAAFAADGPVALGPNQGKFGDWTAAIYGTGAAKTCYAFTQATNSNPAIPGRGTVLLTVTERAAAHDEVTLAAGYTYPAHATPTLAIGNQKIRFYTQGQDAFTTAGSTAIAAFKTQATAESTAPSPHGHSVADDFSLHGFSDAYHAITSACP
jgi:hypothetical protein